MNYKTTTITLTLTLTFSYIGLILLYSSAVADGLNIKSDKRHGRNAAEHISKQEITEEAYYKVILVKEVWEEQLELAEFMLKKIKEKEQQQVSNQ